VDQRGRFIDLCVGWPGSVADGRIWNNSALNRELDNLLANIPSVPLATKHPVTAEMRYEHVPAFILADSAYASTKQVVPTYRTTECDRDPVTKKLNKKLSSIRYSVEQAFGILKNRFRILFREMECAKWDAARATRLIMAICTLHNFIIHQEGLENDEYMNGNRAPEFEFESVMNALPNVDNGDEEVENEHDNATRNILYRHMQWKMQV
jgi:hypothetical protein